MKKNAPEINIYYNRFLDPIFVFYCQNNPELKKRGWNDWVRPETKILLERVKRYREVWATEEEKILRGICDVLNLEFKRNVIDVHIVSGLPRPFSVPIVIKSGFSPEEFVDVLTHELIHVLFQDNIKCVPISILSEMFPDESELTRNHILVHAILTYLYLDILKNENRLHRNKESSSKADAPDYNRAWKIVEERGYHALIEEFKKKCHSLEN